MWVFIAQLVEHCSVNAEAKGPNPVKVPKIFLDEFSIACIASTTVTIISSFRFVFPQFTSSSLLVEMATTLKYSVSKWLG